MIRTLISDVHMQVMMYSVHFIDLCSLLSSAGFRITNSLPSFMHVQLDTHTIPPAILIGTTLMCIAAGIRVVSYRYLGPYFTFQLSIKKDHRLITDGPYAIVRHPSYTGSCIHLVGMALSLLGPGSIYAELGFGRTRLRWRQGSIWWSFRCMAWQS